MLDPAGSVKQMAGVETELIQRLPASPKNSNHAQARSVLIHFVMNERVKSATSGKGEKAVLSPGYYTEFDWVDTVQALHVQAWMEEHQSVLPI